MAFLSWSPSRSGGNALLLGGALLTGCRSLPPPTAAASAGGDEIIVAGQRFHTGTRVIAWMDPGGYNGYQGKAPPGPRPTAPGPKENDRVRPGVRELAALQQVVDQFVLHYDGCGLSKICFNTLQSRALSVHFLLDVDGTVYQTLDLQERALHATTSNDRSIGIEIANIGAYPPGETKVLDEWYVRDAQGQTRLQVPARIVDARIHTEKFTGRPARPAPVRGALQGQALVQYDFTPEQYAALGRLTAVLCRVFPKIKPDFPRDSAGRLVTRKLPDEALARYQGILGHFHIQENKTDPGPAVQWHRILEDARRQMK